MVHMKEGKLSPLFAQDDKDGVPEIPNLRNVKQPQKVGQRGILPVVCNTWSDGVTIAVSQKNTFDCHVRTKHDLRHIVHELDGVRVDGRHYLHDP